MTAIEQLMFSFPSGQDIMQYISENQPDEKMLDQWIWEQVYKEKNWKEKSHSEKINYAKFQCKKMAKEIAEKADVKGFDYFWEVDKESISNTAKEFIDNIK